MKNEKMKNKKRCSVVLLLGLWFFVSCLGYAAEKRLTGAEWGKLFRDEKARYLSVLIKEFRKKGIPLSKSTDAYVYTMDMTVAADPQWELEDAESIFASLVYENEPEARRAIDRLNAPGK